MEPHFPLPRWSDERLLCWHARLLTLTVWCCYVFVCASRKLEAVLSKGETRSRRRRVVKFCAHCCCLLFDRVIQSSPKLVTAACSLSFGLLFCCESYSTIVVVVCDWITNTSPEIYLVVCGCRGNWKPVAVAFIYIQGNTRWQSCQLTVARVAVATCFTQTKGKSQSRLAGGRKRKQQQT